MRLLARALILTASLFVLMASDAAAQSIARPRSWTLTPFLHTSIGIGDPARKESLGLGVGFGYDWTRNLGFEGEVSHLFDVAGDTPDVDWSITNFSANAIFHFDVVRVTPYATVGLGFERSGHDIKSTDPTVLALLADFSATEIAFNFGGGLKYPINDRWLARVDLRRFQANDIAPDYFRLYGGLTFRIGG